MVKVEVLSVNVDCPECGNNQLVDAAEFGESKITAFTEYSTECDRCDHKFEFELCVFE